MAAGDRRMRMTTGLMGEDEDGGGRRKERSERTNEAAAASPRKRWRNDGVMMA